MNSIEEIRFRADYLVPVYNIDVETAFVTEYNNGVRWVRLWLVKAMRGDERASMCQAVARELDNYKNALKANPSHPDLMRGVHWMEMLQTHMAQSVFYKTPDKILEQSVSNSLARSVFQSDIKQALYLEGVAYMRVKAR